MIILTNSSRIVDMRIQRKEGVEATRPMCWKHVEDIEKLSLVRVNAVVRKPRIN
jgi:hypothetical protein